MPKSDNKKSRKPRSDKFPLTLHKTGQYCKKICGKIYYFGVDKKLALHRCLEQASMLHSGKTESIVANQKSVSLKYLSNMYLEYQYSSAAIGQIKIRHISDQKILLKDFARFVGSNTLLSLLTTFNVQNYISRLIKKKRTANTINNRIAVIKSLFNWAIENEIIEHGPNLKAIKKNTNTVLSR